MKNNSPKNNLVLHKEIIQILCILLIAIITITAMHFGYNINMSINPAESEYTLSLIHDQQDQDNAKEDSVVEDQTNLPSTTDNN